MAKSTKPSKKRKSFMSKPHFEGGIKAMRAMIKENMKYPKEAIKNKIEGSVKIRYDIDYKGNVFKTKVIKGIGHGCDEEAQRLVKLFKFKLDRTRKMKVIFHKTIQINFKLPKEAVKKVTPRKPQPASIQYNMISKSKQQEPKQDKTTTYSYTIRIG